MSGFGYDVLGFGSGAEAAIPEVDDEFNRTSYLNHFDGANNGVNNVFDDGSASNKTVTANGNVTQGSFGPFARPEGEFGVYFSNSDLALAGNALNAIGNANYTVEAWVFVNAANGNYIQATYENTNGGELNVIKINNGSEEQYLFGTTTEPSQTVTSFSDKTFDGNTWTHVAVVRNSGTVKAYINGIVSSTTVSMTGSAYNLRRIGGGRGFSVGNGDLFLGKISNVRYSNIARYTSNFTPPTTPFSSDSDTNTLACQSNRFVDNSSNARAVTPTARTTITAFGPFLTDAAYDPAVNGASAYFDGNGDYLSTPSQGTLAASSNWCMECYFYCTGVSQSTAYRIMSVNEAADAANYTMFRIRAGQYEFYSGGGSDAAESGLVSTAKFHEWTHIALTKSGTTVRGFVNGIKLWEATHNATSVISSLVMGWGYGSEYFPGYISDARLVNGSSIYTANFTPPTAPLTAITNTTLLLNMADGQAIDSTATTGTGIIGGNAKLSTGQSKFGGTSMLFDGTGDYIVVDERNLSSPLFILNTAFTIECWAYLTTWTDRVYDYNAQSMFSKGQVYINLGIDTNQKLLAYHYDGTLRGIRSSATFPLNSWRHVAWCVTGNAQKLFLDGTEVASGTWYGAAGMYSNGLPQTGAIGGDTAGTVSGWIGNIDEFRISTTARYTSNFTAPTKPFPDQGQL